MEVFSVLTRLPQIFRGAVDASEYYLLNLRPTGVPDTLAMFRVVGRLAAYITWITGWGPYQLSPVFFLYALGGESAVFDLELLDELLPAQAAILRSWPAERGPAVNVSVGSHLSMIAIEYLDVAVSIASILYIITLAVNE